MTKKVKDDFNVTSNLRYIFQRAVIIANDIGLDYVDTAAIIISMFKDDYSVLNEIFELNGILINIDAILSDILNSKEKYEDIFGVKYPFEEQDQAKKLRDEQKEEIANVIRENTEKEISEDQIKDAAENVLQQFEIAFIPSNPNYDFDVPYDKILKQAVFDAGNRCRDNGVDYIDEENLLYSILNTEECSAKKIFDEIGESISENTDIEFDIIDLIESLIDNHNICFSLLEKKLTIPKPLESCCTILNDKYEKNVKCDILGRDEELAELWGILSKKQKSNAILTGEAGVGKSAIVEALTMSIVNGTCPEKFKDHKVVELNISGMVAGTKYRGEFEKKVEYLVNFINAYDNLIIFVDEIHHLMGAGAAEGSGPDLSGSLKPILARDKVKFIGATTEAEYRKYICRDNAFRRRLEVVNVKEPKQSEVLPILKIKIENLMKYHGVSIDNKVLEYIQLCAACFNTSTCNPDKTLDLIDRAMATTAYDSKEVRIEHVNKVFARNYKLYEKNSPEENRRTAYHEAGHFIAHHIYKDTLVDMEVYAVSVIPGFDFLGANILEETQMNPKCDKYYYTTKIASLLAGRAAEEVFFNEKTSGASNDLGKVSHIARRMITEFGLSKNKYSDFSIYNDETGNTLPLSEKTIDAINKEAQALVSETYSALLILFRAPNIKAKIKKVAETLLERKIVSAKELEEIISNM